MSGLGDAVLARNLVYGNVAQRVKKFDRQLELLLEELAHVGSAGAGPAKESALRSRSLLLRAVMTDRAHKLRVQPRHGAAHNLGNARHVRIGSLGIGAAQTNEPVAPFALFRGDKGLVEFARN